MNIKRSIIPGVWKINSDGTNTGSSFMMNDVKGNFKIGTISSLGAAGYNLSDAQVLSSAKYIFTNNNEFMVPIGTNTNVIYTPQISFHTAGLQENTGLWALKNSLGAEAIGLSSNGNRIFEYDTLSNIILNGTTLGYQPSFSSLANINVTLGSGTFLGNSDGNLNWGYNTYSGSNNISFGNRVTIYTNTITSSYNYNIGYSNELNGSGVGAGYNYVMGYWNKITGVQGKQSTLIGNGLTCTQQNNFIIGQGNQLVDYSQAGAGMVLVTAGVTKIMSNVLGTTGVALAPGGGAWATISDRNLKENIKEIDHKNILDKIISTPVTEWNYITQKVDTMNKYSPIEIHYDVSPIHIGPMAQDFSSIFGYGEYKDKITSSDIDGVMFSGIKALAEENKLLKVKLEEQAKSIEELKRLINEIKNR